MQTGENEQALRKILDMTRLMGIALLLIHFYYYCFDSFRHWNLAPDFACRILENIHRTGLLDSFHKSKLFALGLLVISLMGARGRKDEKLHFRTAFYYISTGLLLYFGSYLAVLIFLDPEVCSVLYISLCSLGYLMTLSIFSFDLLF